MEEVPPYINLIFAATTFVTFCFAVYAVKIGVQRKRSRIPFTYGFTLLIWLFLTAWLAANHFFDDFSFKPPKLFFFVIFYVISGLIPFMTQKGRAFLKQIPITSLTYLHIIRVPVEIVLWWLFLEGQVPEKMTFEGVNYDIISGITAPFAAIFLVGYKGYRRTGAIIWNVLALMLLINIVAHAILATPFFYDPAIYDTKNVAVLYPPFVWLPVFVAPSVLLAHIISLYQLISRKEIEE